MPDVQVSELQNLVLRALGTLLRIGLILLLAALSYGAVRMVARRLEVLLVRESEDLGGERTAARVQTINRIIQNTALVAILVVTGIMILDELGLNITPILAGVGVAGLAVGVGAQTLVKDAIAGLFLLIEQQFDVGDEIEVKGVTGTVENITLRTTIVRDSKGTQHVIPNGEIRILANRSRDWARAAIEVSVPGQEPIGRVLKVLQTAGETLKEDPELGPILAETPHVTDVQKASEATVTLRMVVRTQPGKQQFAAAELQRRVQAQLEAGDVRVISP